MSHKISLGEIFLVLFLYIVIVIILSQLMTGVIQHAVIQNWPVLRRPAPKPVGSCRHYLSMRTLLKIVFALCTGYRYGYGCGY